MTKTTSTTKKSKAVAEVQDTAQQTSALPAGSLDPEQARKDLAAIFAKAAKAAATKAATKPRAKAARPKAS